MNWRLLYKVRAILGAIAFLLTLIGMGPADARVTQESRVKAAFIYKFLLFTDFPEEAFSNDADAVAICLLGPHPFEEAFDPVEGKRVKGRILEVRELGAKPSRAELTKCHLLFIGEQNAVEVVQQTLAATKDSPVLTVGEHEPFIRHGGMIRLYRDGGHVAFDVNARVARQVGISFRAQMLRIAKRVEE